MMCGCDSSCGFGESSYNIPKFEMMIRVSCRSRSNVLSFGCSLLNVLQVSECLFWEDHFG